MFSDIVESLKQPVWFQRGILHTPLDAMSYTNNALLVMSALGILGGIFVIAFTGDVSQMAHQISSINEMKRKYISEKIDIMSVDLTNTSVIVTLTNFGKYPVDILGVVDGTGTQLSCISNNVDSKNFTIPIDTMTEFTCPIKKPFDDSAIHYIITDTNQILEIKP